MRRASSFFSAWSSRNLAALEAQPKVLYEYALKDQRHGRVDYTLGGAGLGGDEELLRGDVGVVEDAVYRAALRAAEKQGFRYQAHLEVRAVGGSILERD